MGAREQLSWTICKVRHPKIGFLVEEQIAQWRERIGRRNRYRDNQPETTIRLSKTEYAFKYPCVNVRTGDCLKRLFRNGLLELGLFEVRRVSNDDIKPSRLSDRMKVAVPMERFVSFHPARYTVLFHTIGSREIVVELALKHCDLPPELCLVFNGHISIEFGLLATKH